MSQGRCSDGGKDADRQTDGWGERQRREKTGRQRDRQTESQADVETDRHKDRQT